MNNVQNMSPMEQAQFMDELENIQMQDQVRLYHDLVKRCFNECCTTFRSKRLSEKEKKCLDGCMEKFMGFQQRSATRFSEFQANLAQQQQQ